MQIKNFSGLKVYLFGFKNENQETNEIAKFIQKEGDSFPSVFHEKFIQKFKDKYTSIITRGEEGTFERSNTILQVIKIKEGRE